MNTQQFLAEKATLDDISSISTLLEQYSKMGNVLPRTPKDIEENIEHFWVIHDVNLNTHAAMPEQKIVACGALEQFTEELIEIRSLVVNPNIQGSGLGRILVHELTKVARNRGAKRLMALTYSVGFFEKLGFTVVEKDIFPEKIWSICVNCYKFNNCDEVAVVLYL